MATNNFNARSDAAAHALKDQLSKQLGKEIPKRPVPVDADGQPARPLPPEGSYARMAIEQQRREAQANRPTLQDATEAPNAGGMVQPQGAPTVVPLEQPQTNEQVSP